MPPQNTFDPVAAYRQAYTGDSRSDQEIANKLRDPANFRKAFPNYDYSAPDADARIQAHMSSYIGTKFPSAPATAQPQSEGVMSWAQDQLGKAVGGFKEFVVDPLTEPYKEGYRDPISYATRIGQGLVDMHKEEYGKLKEAASAYATDPSNANAQTLITHTMGQFPILGPAAVAVGETASKGEFARAGGQAAGLIFGERLTDAALHPVKEGFRTVSEKAAQQPTAPATDVTADAPQVPREATRSTSRGPQTVSDFKGMSSPIRPYDPQGTRFAQGGTVGMDQLDPNYKPPVPEIAKDAAPIRSTDSMGIRWAQDPKSGYRVSIPSRVTEDQVSSYLQGKFEEQAQIHSSIRTDIADKAVDQAVPSPRVAVKGSGPRVDRPAVPEGMPEPAPINPQEARDMSTKLGFNVSVEQVNQVLRDEAQAADVADRMAGNRGDAVGEIREKKRSELEAASRAKSNVPVGTATVDPTEVPVRPDNKAPEPAPVQAGQPKPDGFSPRVRVNPDLPPALQKSMDLMVKLKKQVDVASTPEEKAALNDQWAAESNRSKALLKQHLRNLDADGLSQLKEKLSSEQTMHDAQASAIRDMVTADKKNRPVVRQLRDMMSSGGPIRAAMDPETGRKLVNEETGKAAGFKPETEIKRGARDLFHELMGEKPFTRVEQLERHPLPKKDGVTQEGWDKLGEKLQAQRMSLRQEISRDLEIARDTGMPVDETGIPEKLRKLHDIERMYGKYPTVSPDQELTGRRTKAPVTLGENGELITKEPLATISLAKARAVMGTKVNKIPSHEEFIAKANELQERGRLRSAVVSVIDKLLTAEVPKGRENEAGIVGEKSPSVKSASRSSVEAKDMDLATMGRAAANSGFKVYPTDMGHPAGYAGWLVSKDSAGKDVAFFDKGMRDHDDLAEAMLPGHRNAMFGLLENEGVRKVNNRAYEAWKMTPKTINMIEMDMLRNGTHGKDLLLDTKGPRGIRAMHIDAGWEDLSSEVRKEMAQPGWKDQSGVGAIPALASAATGMAIGTKLGGIPGGVAGFAIGAVAPAVLQTRMVRRTMSTMAQVVRNAGVPLRQWVNGPVQNSFMVDPKMDAILNEQAGHSTFAGPKLVERLAMLPGNIYRGFDRFALVNGGAGQVGRLMMSLDPRGRAFRDLSKPDNQALYIAAREASKQIKGLRADAGIEFAGVMKDAVDKGIGPQLKQYLNLKAYQRVYDVINEHQSDLALQEQNITTKMQSPSITSRQMVALQDDLREVKSAQSELQKKLQGATAVPKNYTPVEISNGLAQLHGQFPALKGLADRVFAQNRQVLDMVHDEGIISDEAYQTYTARGDEYIPMQRIMDDLDQPAPQAGQNTSPLYLRHQTVINSLEGSERTNVDPLEASSNHNAKAFSQIIRNRVMNDALDLVQAYPQQLSGEFKPVSPDYRAKIGEGIVGVYKDGQPTLFAVPKYLHEALAGAPMQSKTAMGVLARYASEKFREGATVANLAFTVPSVFTHAASSLFLSETGLQARPDIVQQLTGFAKDWTKSVRSVLNQDQQWREMVRSGAAFSTAQRIITPEYFTNPSELGFKGKLAKGRILDAMKDLNAAAEDVNKLTTFTRMRRAGASVKQAAWESSNYGGAPDFSRMGDFSQGMNLALMFFNANLQYMHQAFTGLQRNPGRVMSLMAGLTALALAANSWNSQQKDSSGNDLLRKISPDERARNFVVLTGETYINHNGAEMPYKLLIPKPPIARYIYNPIENTVNYASGKETRTGQQQILDTVANYIPGRAHLEANSPIASGLQSMVASANPIAKVGVEQYANKNDYGQPLVPGSLQKVDPSYQSLATTSATADQMGQGGKRGAEAGAVWGAMFGSSIAGGPGAAIGAAVGGAYGSRGVSPIRTDNVIRNIGGGLSQGVTAMTDPFFSGNTPKPTLEGPEALRKVPVVGSIASRFLVGSSNDQQLVEQTSKFYDNVQKLETIKNTANMLFKTNPQEAQKFVQDHKEDFFRASLAQSLSKSLGSFGGLIHQVQGDQSMNPQQKEQAMRQLYDAKMKMLREFNQVLDKR